MAKVATTALHDFVTGEVVTEIMLDQNFEVIRVALNDNYDRLIKQYQVMDAVGVVKGTQLLDAILNTIKFKEGGNITLLLDPATSTLTIGVTGVVLPATLDAHKTSSDHDSRYYTEAEVDTKLGQVAVGNPPDRSIPGIKLQANTVTAAELSAAYAKGAVNGIASLGADGLVLPAQLPATTELRTLRLRSMFK